MASVPPGPVAFLSNGGLKRYQLEVESTTGFVAYHLSTGVTLVSEATQMSIQAVDAISFWSCVDYQDTSHAGRIVSVDCHDCGLTYLDVTALTDLQYLDCSFNALTTLPLANLRQLLALDADENQLVALDLRELRKLQILNCAGNHLKTLDLRCLTKLEILDCSGNPDISVMTDHPLPTAIESYKL